MVLFLYFASFILNAAFAVNAFPQVWALRGRAADYQARHAQPNQRVPGPISATNVANGPAHEFSKTWSGAIIHDEPGAFTSITGTFVVPRVSLPPDAPADVTYAGSAWVGFDGYTCTGGILQAGVDFLVQGTNTSYRAWSEWWIDPSIYYDDFTIREEDKIRVTVTALTTESGYALIENLSAGDRVNQTLATPWTICEQDADWVVEVFGMPDGRAPFADFGTVTFTDATVSLASGGTLGPSDVTNLIDLSINDTVYTSTTITSNAISIEYVRKE